MWLYIGVGWCVFAVVLYRSMEKCTGILLVCHRSVEVYASFVGVDLLPCRQNRNISLSWKCGKVYAGY